MAVDRRILFGLLAALPFGRAFARSVPPPTPGAPLSEVEQSALAPPPTPDVPRSEIEQSALARQNEAVIRRLYALYHSGDFLAATQSFSEDTGNHGVPVGRKGLLRVLTDIYSTFPDYSAEIKELAAIDDIVVVREMDSGTHKGVARSPSTVDCL